jgi:hypothetical protein
MMFPRFRSEIILVACTFAVDVRHKFASRLAARPVCVPSANPGASPLFPMRPADTMHAQAETMPARRSIRHPQKRTLSTITEPASGTSIYTFQPRR